MWQARAHCIDMDRETSVYLFTAIEKDKVEAAETAPSLSQKMPATTAPTAPTPTSDVQAASRLLFLLMPAITITVAVEGSTLLHQTAIHHGKLQETFVSTFKTQPQASKLNSYCSNNKNSTRSKPRNWCSFSLSDSRTYNESLSWRAFAPS